MRLNPAPVALEPMVQGIVKMFRGQAAERQTALNYFVGAGVPGVVIADSVRLRQVLANLVGNAVKFTEGGQVDIVVTCINGWTTFEVRDTGIGIASDRLEAIFDRFHQAKPESYAGTGLGLTISRALAELMGGEVQVQSTFGSGSSFTFRVPLQEARDGAGAVVPSDESSFEGRKVLLVDDNRVNVLVSAHALRKFGCEVVCAEDGLKALQALEQEPFDLVFMDVRMPVLDGLEATRRLRQVEGRERRTPVVALTAGAMVEEQQECFDAGMDDFTSKPFTTESIRDVLARWLGARPRARIG